MDANIQKSTIIKLLAKGYKFIRYDDHGGSMGDKYKIKNSGEYGTWRTLELFDTKIARDRRAKELVEKGCYLYLY